MSRGLAEERYRDARILVIDDQAANVRVIQRILERDGYRGILTTTDPDVGLELALSSRPDLVLLDLRMPGRDGFSVLAELRERASDDPFLPVLVLTADADPEARRAALGMGAKDYLTKPFDVEEALLRCRNLLETRFLYEDLADHNRRLAETVALRSSELAQAQDAHRAVLASLARLQAGGSVEETAAALSAELVDRAAFDSVAILGFSAPDVLVLLGSAGRLRPAEFIGRPLPRGRSRHLRARALEGPWVETILEQADDGSTNRPVEMGDVAAALYAPITGGGRLMGLLAVGSETANLEDFAHRLPTVVDYAVVCRALLAPALTSRRLEAESKQAIRRVIMRHAFSPVFQPIVRLDDGSVLGFEALTRFEDGTRPDVRFAEADALGLGIELEESCLGAAIEAAHRLPLPGWVSLNVSPQLLLEATRLDALLQARDRLVVLEVTEHVPVEEYTSLRDSMDQLVAPAQFAIDDVGAGFASFRHIVELRPDYVKLDIALVRSIEADAMRQAVVTGLRYFAARTDCTLIAEGVETEAERATLRDLGVVFGQGYLFGRPATSSFAH
jgi:EAL domain-containing protein (putative c-di-GMP-specific phosphodiesterase class I)/DNA-binding response OmpR family regulator